MSQAAADALVAEANELFRTEQFADAAARFERAVAMVPQYAIAWKGLGHALLCLGQPHEAARAFDQAIGLHATSATALWGGALAHAEVGNKPIARNYLRRTLELQPSWIAMARGVAPLALLLSTSARAADLLHTAFGAFSTRRYRHARAHSELDIGRIAALPILGQCTFVTIGLSDVAWTDARRPRVELVMATTLDDELCGQILANLAFHLGETGFFPEPGTMVRDVVGALGVADLSQRLPHVYVISPRTWQIELPLEVGPPAITIAQVFPISELEYQAWRRLGPQRFEQTLVERKIEVADLRRTGL